uniref:Uncharacterized protein n=1 Tax=Timema poppense TaxID=170557 RepID=A0A7R9CQI2_TIMPO|nr:unnamed protein product [Timema poppensis]
MLVTKVSPLKWECRGRECNTALRTTITDGWRTKHRLFEESKNLSIYKAFNECKRYLLVMNLLMYLDYSVTSSKTIADNKWISQECLNHEEHPMVLSFSRVGKNVPTPTPPQTVSDFDSTVLTRRLTGLKGERVWVVFCVHDDSEAFLELYSDQKVAVAHKPDWFTSLNNCLHVSPTICPQEDEDLMIEWVETIRSKLREMKILSPKENIYSKMPEARLPLAPTRDPNSPLPPPPAGPSTVLPGVEPVHSSESSDSSSSVGSVEGSTSADSSSDDSSHPPQREAYDNVSLQMGSASSSLYITHSEPPVYTRLSSEKVVLLVVTSRGGISESAMKLKLKIPCSLSGGN